MAGIQVPDVDTPGPDLLVCLALFFLGIAASTLWIVTFGGVLQLAGLGFIFAGIVACGLAMDRRERREESVEDGTPR